MSNVGVTTLFILIVLPTGAAVGGIDAARERSDRTAARQLERIADDALAAGQGATARRLLERALDLYPESTPVRKALGYGRKAGEWVRAPEEETRIRMMADADPVAAATFREKAREAEAARARNLVRAAEREPMTPELRALLTGLLDRVPREEAVHRALGHEELDGRFVRPELVPLARRRAEIEAAWAAARDAAGEAVEDLDAVRLDGVDAPLDRVRAGGREVASVFGPKQTGLLARDAFAAYRLLRALFPEGPVYDPPLVFFLDEDAYAAWHRAEAAGPDDLAVRLSRSDYHGDGFALLRARTAKNARDVHAHVTGYFSLQFLSAPPDPIGGEGDVDSHAYAWLKEGAAYFLSLELYDSAETWFSSDDESTAKIRHVVPAPEVRTRETSRDWIRAHLLDGAAWTLPEVFGKTLNTLDLMASLEAWSFLRFLALYDPDGLAKLPAALRAETEGSMPARADRALEAAFGAGTAELGRLWRAYVLEVE